MYLERAGVEDVGVGFECHAGPGGDGHDVFGALHAGLVAGELLGGDIAEAGVGLPVQGLADVLPVAGRLDGGEGV